MRLGVPWPIRASPSSLPSPRTPSIRGFSSPERGSDRPIFVRTSHYTVISIRSPTSSRSVARASVSAFPATARRTDFRELPRAYGLLDQATGDARMLNATRRSKRLPPIDIVLIYVRLGNVVIRSDAEGQP
jgi:hypothetical protein